jgi:hypothetical protein
MATTIKIKRGTGTSAPGSLSAGELAYTGGSGTSGNSGSRLFIGNPADGSVLVIGGKYFADLADHTPGTLTASSAIITDSSSKIDNLLVDNLQFNGNTISTTSGALTLTTTGTVTLNHGGTVDASAQTNILSIKDNEAASLDIKEGSTSYLKFVTTNSSEKIVVGQDTTFADDVSLVSDSAVLNFGADNDVNLTHVADTGLLFNSNSVFQFRDNALTIGSSTDGQLDIDADTELEITAPTVDINASTSVNISNDLKLDSDSAVLGFGADNDVTLTHVADTALMLNSSMALRFRDAALSLSSPSDGILALAADTEVDITATTIDINGNADVSGSLGAGSTTLSTLKVSDLTNNRVVIAGTSGEIEDDGNFTFDGSTLALTAAMDVTGDLDVDDVNINGSTVSTTASNTDLTLSPNGTGTVKVPSGYVDRSGYSTLSLATKGYVDSVKQALDIKDAVKAASVSNFAASRSGSVLTASGNGAFTLDGVTLAASDRVLMKNQSTAADNGIYTVTTVGDGSTAAVLTRATDADASVDVTSGMFVFVTNGTVNGGNGFVLTTADTITLNTTSLSFTQFSGAGTVTAGDGLTTGGSNIFAVNPDNVTIAISSDAVKLKGDVTTTALGDLLIGKASDGGYKRLAVSTGGANQLLQINSSGNDLEFTDTLDGGTF